MTVLARLTATAAMIMLAVARGMLTTCLRDRFSFGTALHCCSCFLGFRLVQRDGDATLMCRIRQARILSDFQGLARSVNSIRC